MEYYLWIKALHVISVIAWMAGMLYMPRLFVYHTETRPGTEESERFKVMEAKLMRIIINPAMIATWIFGGSMIALQPGLLQGQHWLHAKLTLVLLLSGIHGFYSRWRKEFAADQRRRSQKFYRIINEIPTLLMIGIVILVIVRPF